MEQNPFPEDRKKIGEGRQAPEPKKGDKHRNPSRNQEQIMMEQNPCPEERKKREKGRQAPEPKEREEGRQAREPRRNQEEPTNHDGTEPLS